MKKIIVSILCLGMLCTGICLLQNQNTDIQTLNGLDQIRL